MDGMKPSIPSILSPFLLVLALALACPAHGATLGVGPSIRPASYALSWRGSGPLAPELEFVSEGRQPDHIPNINRVLLLNLVASYPVTPRLTAFAKAGLASSRWSTNGSGNGYSNPGRPGWDVGWGLDCRLSPRWGLRLETVRMHHQQSDVPAFETFTLTTVQVVMHIN